MNSRRKKTPYGCFRLGKKKLLMVVQKHRFR